MKRILLLVSVLVVLAAGCGLENGQIAFLQSERGSRLEALTYRITLQANGTLRVRMTGEFLDDDGGILPIPKPLLGGIENLQVDGRPARGRSDFETVNVPVDARTAVATFVITGGVKAGDDITAIDTPLVVDPSDASRQDPPVDVSGVLILPEGTPRAAIDFHWINGLDQDVAVKPAKVRFNGRSPLWTSSDLLVGLPPGLAPGLAGDFSAVTSVSAFQNQVTLADANSESLESTLDNQDSQQRLVSLLLVGIGLGMSLLMVFQWYRLQTSDRRARERYQGTFPDQVADPPDAYDPAVVALMLADGHKLDQDAVAGTVLDLAHRRVIQIDGYGPHQWVIKVPSAATAELAHEQIVLDGLRAQAPTGEIVGPPLWSDKQPGWWRSYRSAVFKRAKDEDLVRRRFRILYVGPFAAGIVCATWPLWATQSTLWIVPVASIALGLVFALPLGGGFEPTLKGVKSAGYWKSFGRYTAAQGHWEDVGPAGIVVWGPYLAYGTVLGTCPFATGQLAPRGGPERATRSEAQDQVDAEALEAQARQITGGPV